MSHHSRSFLFPFPSIIVPRNRPAARIEPLDEGFLGRRVRSAGGLDEEMAAPAYGSTAVPGGDSSAAEEDAFESAYRVRSQRGRSLLESDNTGFEMTSDRFESRFGVLDSGYDGV